MTASLSWEKAHLTSVRTIKLALLPPCFMGMAIRLRSGVTEDMESTESKEKFVCMETFYICLYRETHV